MNADSVPLRQAMFGLIPNLRAFAVSLCGDIERADDLVQDRCSRLEPPGSFQEAPSCGRGSAILRNTYFSDAAAAAAGEVAMAQGRRACRPSASRGTSTCRTSAGAQPLMPRPAGGADPGGGGRLLLRGGGGDIGVRRRHDQEPRQPGAIQAHRPSGRGDAARVRAGPGDGGDRRAQGRRRPTVILTTDYFRRVAC